ncbi:MAG: hypothetical protein K0S61_254 [Anaerocolumna sp.]|nr:hypothetical protein [Anaerocolumna sp.]
MSKNKLFKLFQYKGFISILFYIAIFVVILRVIIPHTSVFYRTNLFDPFFHRLNREDITLIKGEEFRLHTYRLNQRVTYSTTDFKVADVNFLGTVTAQRPGTAFIILRYKNEELKCRVKVVEISKSKLVIKKSKSYRLKIKGTMTGVRWYSSNASVASVSRFGNVKARSKGSAVIYGKIDGKTMSCKVTVK